MSLGKTTLPADFLVPLPSLRRVPGREHTVDFACGGLRTFASPTRDTFLDV